MGKDSLIKSTTKKKPANEKDNDTKQAKKTTAKAKKAVNAKPDVTPRKKTAKVKESAKKKPAVKSKPTKVEKKTPKKTAPAKKPTKVQAEPKPTPVVKTSIPAKVQAETKPTPVVKTSIPDKPDSIDYIPPPETKPADPADKMLYYGMAGFVLLVLIIVLASWINTQRYYVKTSEGAVGIWQGKFAPKGAKHLISFPGLQVAKPIKDIYTANEVFPTIYQYYLDKADMLLEVPGMPDFDGVKEYLDKSLAYATTREMKKVIKSRLNAINLMVLLTKAEVVASKSTPEDQETALGYLKDAMAYEMDELDSARIKQKIEIVRTKIKDLKATAAQAVEGDNGK